jgi:hypothetical protein
MAIDYDSLLEKLLQRKRISKKRHAEYADDSGAVDNDISCDGKQVLTLGWDGNFPGCSGAIYITRWKGFFFTSSSDYDPEGPFETLKDALNTDRFEGPIYKPELSSDSLSHRRLLDIANSLVSDAGEGILVNDQRHTIIRGRLVKSKADS